MANLLKRKNDRMTKKNIDFYSTEDLKILVEQFMVTTDIETTQRLRLVLISILDSIVEHRIEKMKTN